MSLIFKPENHKYESVNGDKIDWISATSFISNFKTPFDAQAVAEKCSKNSKSKWYKLPPSKIIEIWNKESQRAMDAGTFYHNEREAELCAVSTIQKNGKDLNIFKPVFKDGIKIAPDQKLVDGIYPEHMVYLKSVGICGQSDLVEVVEGGMNILDYKTNKSIDNKSFVNWEGISKKMLFPLSHLDDCNINHYTLQLSLYMYIMLKHNPELKAGKLTLHHIIFEEAGRDEYDYPIMHMVDGKPVVKEIVPYDVPYLKQEITTLINWLKTNRNKIKSKK
jgi:hypothetical protein